MNQSSRKHDERLPVDNVDKKSSRVIDLKATGKGTIQKGSPGGRVDPTSVLVEDQQLGQSTYNSKVLLTSNYQPLRGAQDASEPQRVPLGTEAKEESNDR